MKVSPAGAAKLAAGGLMILALVAGNAGHRLGFGNTVLVICVVIFGIAAAALFVLDFFD